MSTESVSQNVFTSATVNIYVSFQLEYHFPVCSENLFNVVSKCFSVKDVGTTYYYVRQSSK